MPKYLFASLRGPDFEVEGKDPSDAWNNLCIREKDEGTLWRTGDPYRNSHAVKAEGFRWLYHDGFPSIVAYKEVKETNNA